ncbi:hypothetical protein FOL46_004810 [Perkinsus olseni]|uniref:Uncharacterized protein n=1 Tax=Perkinsus olseni TaxID=32597 RepID=A0A7J6LVK5_PEROL|nr:hypothetical protein FOL46_004810 [Perkinsus olseni]
MKVLLLATVTAAAAEGKCIITSSVCEHFLHLTNKQFEDVLGERYLGTADNEPMCLRRAQQFHDWCGNPSSQSSVTVAASFNARTQLYSPDACDDGWVLYGSACYRFVDSLVDFFEAEARCNAMGANLASIHSEAENEFVRTLTGGRSTWIGYSDTDQDEDYDWTDGSENEFNKWANNCTDPAYADDPDCAPQKAQEQWYGWDGSDPGPFVCKKQAKGKRKTYLLSLSAEELVTAAGVRQDIDELTVEDTKLVKLETTGSCKFILSATNPLFCPSVMEQQPASTNEAPAAAAAPEAESVPAAEASSEPTATTEATPAEMSTEASPADPATEASPSEVPSPAPAAAQDAAPTSVDTTAVAGNATETAVHEEPEAIPVPLPATPASQQEPPASPMDVAAATAVASAAAIQQEFTTSPPVQAGSVGQSPAPAPRYDGPPKRGDDTKKVFVGGLPREADKPALDEYFSQFGPVEDSVVMMDRYTGRSRGFGFVTFQTKEQMLGCVAAAPHVIMGKSVEVRRSVNDDGTSTANERRSSGKGAGAPRSYDDYSSGKGKGGHRDQNPNKLFVGGLPREVTSDVLRDFFIQYGNLVDCTVITDRMTGQSRGFGYITYEDLSAAEAAISNSANNVIDGKWVDVKHTTREAPRRSFGGYNEYGSGGYGDHGRYRGPDDYQATMRASKAASNAYFQQQQNRPPPMGMYQQQQPQYGMPPPQQGYGGMQQQGGYGGMGYQRQEPRRPPMGGYNAPPPRYGGQYGGPSRASPY